MFEGHLPNGYFYNILFLLWTTCLWLLSRNASRVKRILLFSYFVFWVINSLIASLVLIQYDTVFTAKSFLFLSTFVLSGALGIWLSFSRFFFPIKLRLAKTDAVVYFFFAVSSAFYVTMTLPDLIARVPGVLNDFSSVRALHWEQYESEQSIGMVNAIGAFARGASFAFVIMTLGSSETSHRFKMAGWLVFLVITFDVLSQAGRSVLIFIILSLLITRFLVTPRDISIKDFFVIDRKFLTLKVPLLLGAVFLFFVFPAIRASDVYFDYDVFLEFRHHARISSYIKFLNSQITPGISGIAFATDYFTIPVVKMTDLLSNSDVGSWFSGGAYSFSVPPKIISLFSGVNFHHFWRLELESEIARQGYIAVRPWTTSALDFAIDYGPIGACIMAFALMFALTSICSVCARRGTLFHISIITVISLCFLISPFKSPFNITVIANCLFIQLILLVVVETLRKAR